MRLDKYLKVSRIIKRRTIANEACDAGRVFLNGKVARASSEVSVGDVIEVRLGARANRYEILRVAETIGKADAGDLFRALGAVDAENE